MKIVINETGKVQEVSEKIASRLINKGKAHPAQIGGVVIEIPELNGNTVKTKKMDEAITEIDLIEPIPERFTSFEKLPEITEENVTKPKTWKPKKRGKKGKKSKFRG